MQTLYWNKLEMEWLKEFFSKIQTPENGTSGRFGTFQTEWLVIFELIQSILYK